MSLGCCVSGSGINCIDLPFKQKCPNLDNPGLTMVYLIDYDVSAKVRLTNTSFRKRYSSLDILARPTLPALRGFSNLEW